MTERKTGIWTRTKHLAYIHTWEYYDWVDDHGRPWDKRQCHGCLAQELRAGPAGWTSAEEALGMRDRFDQRAHGEGISFDQPNRPDRPAPGTTPLDEILGRRRPESRGEPEKTEAPEREAEPERGRLYGESEPDQPERPQPQPPRQQQRGGMPSWGSSWMVRGIGIFFGIQFLIAIISAVVR